MEDNAQPVAARGSGFDEERVRLVTEQRLQQVRQTVEQLRLLEYPLGLRQRRPVVRVLARRPVGPPRTPPPPGPPRRVSRCRAPQAGRRAAAPAVPPPAPWPSPPGTASGANDVPQYFTSFVQVASSTPPSPNTAQKRSLSSGRWARMWRVPEVAARLLAARREEDQRPARPAAGRRRPLRGRQHRGELGHRHALHVEHAAADDPWRLDPPLEGRHDPLVRTPHRVDVQVVVEHQRFAALAFEDRPEVRPGAPRAPRSPRQCPPLRGCRRGNARRRSRDPCPASCRCAPGPEGAGRSRPPCSRRPASSCRRSAPAAGGRKTTAATTRTSSVPYSATRAATGRRACSFALFDINRISLAPPT